MAHFTKHRPIFSTELGVGRSANGIFGCTDTRCLIEFIVETFSARRSFYSFGIQNQNIEIHLAHC